jgi:hypothetical protein
MQIYQPVNFSLNSQINEFIFILPYSAFYREKLDESWDMQSSSDTPFVVLLSAKYGILLHFSITFK